MRWQRQVAILSATWKAPRTTMRTRQRQVRALITEIVVDVDPAAGAIVLVIHWKGGQHSELRSRPDVSYRPTFFE
jgi:hypothetical protein